MTEDGRSIHRGDKVTYIPMHGPSRYDAVVTAVRDDGYVDLARPMNGDGDETLVEVSKVPPNDPDLETGGWVEGWTDAE